MELVWCKDGGGKCWMTLVASPECPLMACEIGGFLDDWWMVVARAWSRMMATTREWSSLEADVVGSNHDGF